MGIGHLMSAVNPTPGLIHRGKETMEEMNELQKMRTAIMMESCQSRDEVIRCPIPRKSSRNDLSTKHEFIKSNLTVLNTLMIYLSSLFRLSREHEFRVAQDLSDVILSKASPPYFSGSPPVRASNPLVHDSQFCAQKVQNIDQSPGIPVPTKDYNVRYNGGREGFLTMA